MSWTLLVVAGLFAVALAEGRYPSSLPGYSAAAYWGAAVATVVVFFASILAHELAHAVVARRDGLPVEGITLWMLGGVARLGGEAPSPPSELRIAAAGPLASLLAGGAFWVVALAAGWLDLSPLVIEVFLWLALINVVLAAFNVLPASPLDGGRILAAILWWRTGDRTKAAVWAGTAGKVLGGALIGFGLFELAVRDAPFGLWSALVGWFIWQSASLESRGAVARHALHALTAAAVAPPDPPVVDDWLTVDGLLSLFPGDGTHTAFPVRGDDGSIRSIVTLDDIRRVTPNDRGWVTVGAIAVPIADITTAWADEPILSVIARAKPDARSEIAVYDRALHLVGVISRIDVERAARGAAPRPAAV